MDLSDLELECVSAGGNKSSARRPARAAAPVASCGGQDVRAASAASCGGQDVASAASCGGQDVRRVSC